MSRPPDMTESKLSADTSPSQLEQVTAPQFKLITFPADAQPASPGCLSSASSSTNLSDATCPAVNMSGDERCVSPVAFVQLPNFIMTSPTSMDRCPAVNLSGDGMCEPDVASSILFYPSSSAHLSAASITTHGNLPQPMSRSTAISSTSDIIGLSNKGLDPGGEIRPAMGEGLSAPLIHQGQGVDPLGDTPLSASGLLFWSY